MLTLVENSFELRDGLAQAIAGRRLEERHWRALRGALAILKVRRRIERKAVLKAALIESRLPAPLKSVIRAHFAGIDFDDAELEEQINAARESCQKATAEEVKAVVSGGETSAQE